MPTLKSIRGPKISTDKVSIINDFNTRKKIKRLLVTIKLPSEVLKNLDIPNESSDKPNGSTLNKNQPDKKRRKSSISSTSSKSKSKETSVNSKNVQPENNQVPLSSTTKTKSKEVSPNTKESNLENNNENHNNSSSLSNKHPHTVRSKSIAFTDELRKIDEELIKALEESTNQSQSEMDQPQIKITHPQHNINPPQPKKNHSQISSDTTVTNQSTTTQPNSDQSNQEYKSLPPNVLSILEEEMKHTQIDDEEEEDVPLLIDKIIFSLKDPLGGSRIKLPIKSLYCKHFDCFDYENFCLFNKLPEIIKNLTKKTLIQQNYEKLSRNGNNQQQFQQQTQQHQHHQFKNSNQYQQHIKQNANQIKKHQQEMIQQRFQQQYQHNQIQHQHHHDIHRSNQHQQQLPFQPENPIPSHTPIISTNQSYPTPNPKRQVVIPQLRLAPYVQVLNNDGFANPQNQPISRPPPQNQYNPYNNHIQQIPIEKYKSNFITPPYQSVPNYKCPICDVKFPLSALIISETFNFFVQRTSRQVDKIELIGLKRYRTIDSSTTFSKTKSPSRDQDNVISLSSDDEEEPIEKSQHEKMQLGNIINNNNHNNQNQISKRNLSIWKHHHFNDYNDFRNENENGDGTSWDDPVVLD
ncbi:hypothetical protein KGF54_001596 [Candida jiufengensis]|uniref:uncharacterized protein n=1 Tax=Candida jiufengensis TaxID=497108 RepID=UPI002225212A|nr:uncharacterized protein KGF54_001596 [Candida jiufengensis]KAI5955035.1 hypothetical protein KGF54_001596 [Candida jiufengensis]